MSDMPAANAAAPVRRSGEFLGHPTCLFTLFFAEMWERFSFYGMKALLILYMVNYLFWRQDEASHVMAWYAGLVYATPVLGGIIADKLTGARWAVVIGGVIIAIGHFLLAFEALAFFYSGLACLVVGTGFLKPNISTQVGALYRTDDERRDSAFTIFYMGINLGAFIGPLVCGWLRLSYSYHHGFAAAGVGMVLGLVVYILGMNSVVRREKQIQREEAEADTDGESQQPGAAGEPETKAAEGAPRKSQAVPNKVYIDRAIVLVVICVFAILFWVGFEQAANVMNLWADKHTNLHVFESQAPAVVVADPTPAPATGGNIAPAAGAPATGGFQLTAEQTQSINPFFIITLAAVFAWFWQYLERHGKQPSTPMKMMFGVFFLSCAYGIMLLAAQAENQKTTAPLVEPPRGLEVADHGAIYNEVGEGDETERVYYGATRLHWVDGELQMRGVLTDLDWMRALGGSATEEFQNAVADLAKQAEDKADEVRAQMQAGTLDRDATWEVSVTVPEAAGQLIPIAGWPEIEPNEPKVSWDSETRTLTTVDTFSEKDQAQLLAAGADPKFQKALTAIYEKSSVNKVSIAWLLAFYLVITIGELCLSPVGLSLVTKAAHPKYVGLFMGFWFFTTGAVSNFLAHYVGGYWGMMTPAEYFIIFGVVGLIATVIMLLLLRVLKPMLHGIH